KRHVAPSCESSWCCPSARQPGPGGLLEQRGDRHLLHEGAAQYGGPSTGRNSRYHGPHAPPSKSGRPRGLVNRVTRRWLGICPHLGYGSRLTVSALASSTSTRICTTRSSTETNLTVARSLTAKSTATCIPYRSRSSRSRAYASTVRAPSSKVGLLP